jgi:uncharacterized membrane protein
MDFKHRIVANTLRSGLLGCVLALSAGTFATAADTAPAPIPATQADLSPRVDTSAQTAAGAPQADNPGAATPAEAPGGTTPAAPAADAAAPASDFKTLDQEVQGMKKDVIDLNKDLFVLRKSCCSPRTPRWPCTCPWTWALFSRWTR